MIKMLTGQIKPTSGSLRVHGVYVLEDPIRVRELEPELAIIDEPLINLDPVMQRKVKDFLSGYVRNGGTIFISTHILEIAKQICTIIGIIYRGKLVYTGRLDDPVLEGRNFEEFFLNLVSRPVNSDECASIPAQYA